MPSVWNLDWLRNFVSRSKNKQHRLTRRKSSRPIRLHLEPFEDRITPAANDLVFRALDATPLTLQLANGVLEIVNSADPANVLASQDYSATNQVLVAANGFDVQLTVDVSMRAVPGGIVFDGGNGDSSLIGPGHDVDWHVTSAGSGDLDGPGFVTFYGVSNLTGAAENRDTFIFSATGSLAGVVDGGAGGFDSVIFDGGHYGQISFTASTPDAGTLGRDGQVLRYAGMEPVVYTNITANDVLIDLSVLESDPNVVRLDPDKVHVFRPSNGNITVESDDGAFENITFSDPNNSLTIKTGFNAKGTDEHIYVDALDDFRADLILDTGSTNKNNDGEDTVKLQGDISLHGHALTVTAETIEVLDGVTISASAPGRAGAITFNGWDITLDSNAQLLAEGSDKAHSGAIDIEAIDNNAYFTPFVNVDISNVSVTVKDGAKIKGGDVTINAAADNQHILSLDEFTDTSTVPKLGLLLTDIVAQAIEGLTQIGAGVSYSEAHAHIDIQSGSEIDAQDFSAVSRANAAAITAPIAFVIGPALGICVTDSNATVAGKVTTTGDATVQSSVDHAVNVFSDVSPMLAGTAALAVSVIKSTSTAQITDGAEFHVGGSLNVLSSTVDRNRTGARSVAGTDGKVGVSIAVSVEVGDTNAFLDGTATATGDVTVSATQEKLPVPNSKLFVVPNWANGVSAQAGVGENTTGDFLDDQKAQSINVVKTKVLAFINKKRGKVDDKVPEAKDNAPSFQVAAAVAVCVDTNHANARIGDGNADSNNKNGKVQADGSITVFANLNDRPDITASSSTVKNAGVTLPGGSDAVENNKFAGSFAVGVGVYNNDAHAIINTSAEVDAKGALDVEAHVVNDYKFAYGVNLIEPLLETPKFKSSDGVQDLTDGDIVEVAEGDSDLGQPGEWYRYHGADRTIDLSKEDYLNTGSWLDIGGRVGKNAKSFIGNLTNYLNNNLGLDANAIDSWSQAVAGGDTDVAVAGSMMFVELNFTPEALIKSGAKINQDANYRTANQDVVVQATSVNDAVNFGGNIKLPGLQGNILEWKDSPVSPGGGTSTNDGKGAVGFTFQFYDYIDTVTAKIEDGVQLHASSLDVDADTEVMSIVVGASGGKSNGVAFNGAFAVNLIENNTIAQIENGAEIDVGANAVSDPAAQGASVFVNATDRTYAILVLGGVAISDHAGIGATVGINIVNRDTEAIIGNKADDNSADTRDTFTAGGNVRLNAKNDGFVGAFTVSGSETSSNSETAPQGETGLRKNDGSGSTDDPGKLPNNQNNYDAVIRELKMKFGETSSQADDPESSGNSKGKAGISISGAVALDILDDDARAYVRNTGAFTVNNGSLTLAANNSTAVGSLAGAVALALGGVDNQNRQVGIAGSVGIDLISGTTDAFVDGPTSLSATGLTMTADRTGVIASLTAGVSGAKGRQGDAIGGAVSVMETTNTTETGLKNTTGTVSGGVTMHANDESIIVLVAGGFGFGGQAGVGASIAFSEIDNTVRSTIDNVHGNSGQNIADFKHTGNVDLQATANSIIVAITASAGVGTQGSSGGGAGTISINFIDNTIEAQILNSHTTSDSSGDIGLLAKDDSLIVALAGAVGAGKTAAFGAALGFNIVSNTIDAEIENSTLRTTGAASLTATDHDRVAGIAIGVAAGTGSGFALEGSVEVNKIVNTIDAHISTSSNVHTDGGVTLQATDTSLLVSIAGGVAASVSGSAGIGASISYNRISNGIAAYIDSSTVQSDNSFVKLSADSKPLLVAIAAAGGGGKTIGGAGTLTINSIANTVDAHMTNSTVHALSNISVVASEAATLFAAALAGAGALNGTAIGASIAYNYVGGPEPADPNVLSYDDGVVDGTKSVNVRDDDTTEKSNVIAIIDNSDILAGGEVIVLAGFDDPTKLADPGPLAAATKSIDPASQVTLTGDAIYFASPHGYTTGDEVVYHKGAAGNTAIGGLQDGHTYYVIVVDANTIKLASSQTNALLGIAVGLGSTGTGAGHRVAGLDFADRVIINPSSSTVHDNLIEFADNHGFTTGQEVVYHKGDSGNTAIGGLTDGATYYVIRVSSKKIQLAATLADANAHNALTLSSTGDGEAHSLTPLGGANSFTPSTAVAITNATADQISFSSDHGLSTGDPVVYHNGGGTSIGGLSEGETYYVIRVDATHIKLAATLSDAKAATPRPIFLTSKGTGTSHSLVVKPSQVTVNGISAPLPTSIGGQIISVTAAGAGSEDIAGAGAVSLNFVRMIVDAHISNAKGANQVQAAGDVLVQANDTSHIDSGTGSLALSLNNGVAINASVGVNDIRNTVTAYVEGAKVQSSAGDVTVSAAETARDVNIVIGGAGTGEGVAFGGSFAINFIKNTVDAHIKSNAVSGASDVDADGSISVQAHDDAAIATLAGNVGASISGTAGVGLAFAVNDVNDTVTALIDGSTANAATGSLTVDATFAKPDKLPPGLDVQIAAMAVSGGGAQSIGGAGSVALNWIRNHVTAKIANVTNLGAGDEIGAAGTLTVSASDNSTINALAGAIAISGIGAEGASGAIGASVAYNYLGGDPNHPATTDNNVVTAAIENVTGSIQAGSLDVHAAYQGQINNITVAGAAAGTFALGGAVSINKIRNTSDAHITGSTSVATTGTGATSVQVRAEDTSKIQVLAGGIGIAIATQTPVSIAAGVSVASNEIDNTIQSYIDNSKVTSAGGVSMAATSTPTIKALTIGVAIGATTGGGGFSGTGAGAGSGNTIQNTIDVHITNSLSTNNKGVFANGGALHLTATDTPTILAGAGGFGFAGAFGGGGGIGGSIGISVAINDVEDTVKAYIDGSTARATGNDVSLIATETADVEALTIGGAVGASGGGGGGVGVGAAGAGSGNTVKNKVYAYVTGGSVVSTLTSGNVTISATDDSTIVANAGGVGIAAAIGGSGGGAVSLGVGAATSDIEDDVQAYVDGAKITSAGGVHLSATETATIETLTIGGAVSAAGGGEGGLSISAAGADSDNTIKNNVQAYIQNSTTAAGKGVAANGGALLIEASDTSSITANGGGVGIAVGIAGLGAASAAVGFSVAHNDIENTVQAFVNNANVSATSHNVELTATENATIDALSIGGAVAVGVGLIGSAAGAGAGGDSSNTVKNTVEAYLAGGGSITTTTSGDVKLHATDTVTATARTVAASVSVAASVFASPSIAIGASLANNDIEDTVRAYSDSSAISSAGMIELTSLVTDTVHATSVAVSVSASISLGSLALSGGGASSTNTINNTVKSFIQGAGPNSRSTINAANDVTLRATENATIDSTVAEGTATVGIAGGSIGISLATNTDKSTVKAYLDNANVTSTNGGIGITATTTDTITSLSVATSLSISIGASGAGGDAESEISPTVEAYAGSATQLSAAHDITISATTTNDSEADTYGASGGLLAIGTATTEAKANGSITAHVDGVITSSDNITVRATATHTADASATALAGGIVSGAGAQADSFASPTVEAFTGNNNLTARQAVMVTATFTPKAISEAIGVSVAEYVGVGASIANATVAPTVSAHVGGGSSTIGAVGLTVTAEQDLPSSGISANAEAHGGSGGILAGISASVATAKNGDANDQARYSGYVADGTTLNITGATAVSANVNSKQIALADNYNLGFVAAGAGAATADSNTVIDASLGANVQLTGSSLSVTATGDDNNGAQVRAGSGGAVAGAGAQTNTNATSTTTAQIKSGNGVKKIDLTGTGTGTLNIQADHTSEVNGQVLVFAGGALAGTGAKVTNDVNSTVEAKVGSSAILWAKNVDIGAVNHLKKPALPDYTNALDPNKTGPNILGATGGLASAAGATSDTNVTFNTYVTISDHATIEEHGIAAAPGDFTLHALNDFDATDKVTLGTGGAIAGAGAFSTIKTDTDLAKVQIGGNAVLRSIGAVTMSARGQGAVAAIVASDTFGVGTVAIAKSNVDIEPDNEVSIGSDVLIHADGDLNVSAGTDTNFNRDHYKITASTDDFAGSAIPIEDVDAVATLKQTNSITVSSGAVLETARNANLHAERLGLADMTGHAHAVTWVSALDDAINGQSFDEGTVETSCVGRIQIDGTIRTGIKRQLFLTLDSFTRGVVGQNPVAPTVSASVQSDGITYSVSLQPLQSTLEKELANAQHQLAIFQDSGNQTLVSFYTSEVNRLEALLEEQGLLDQPTSNQGTPPPQFNKQYVITVDLDDIYAAAGVIDVRGDILLGSGTFDSPGDAKVIIHNSTPAFLNIHRITIPQTNGGVFYNGNPVSSALVDDYNVFENGQPIVLPSFAPFALPGTGVPPVIEIKNTFNPLTYSDPQHPNDKYPAPDITVLGNIDSTTGILRGIDNLNGNVDLIIQNGKGNIEIDAPVRAKNLSVITGGDVVINGVTQYSVGGEALSQWRSVTNYTQNGTAASDPTVQAAIAAILALPLGSGTTVQIATVSQGVAPSASYGGAHYTQAIALPYATGGTFQLTFNGNATAPLPYNVDAQGLQNALNALPQNSLLSLLFGRNTFSVSGTGTHGDPFIATLVGNYLNFDPMTANVSNLIGAVALYGDKIFITANYININGVMQSGKPDYTLNIGTAASDEIQRLKNAHARGLQVLNSVSNSDFTVRYDPAYNRIQVEEVQVSGGQIELHGHVVNTGKGEIRLLGGYGNITINNTTSYNVVLERLDASQRGAGKLLIQDTAKGANYVTLYEKAGNQVTKTVDDGTGPVVSSIGNASTYTPQSGYRYGWSVSQEQFNRTTTTYATSTWLGIDDLAADPDDIVSQSTERIGQPVLVGEGPYYYVDGNLTSTNYTFDHASIAEGEATTYVTDRHTESTWYGDKTYYTTTVTEQKSQEIYTHTIKADRSVGISFLGYDEGTISVTSSAGILVDGPILNPSGVTTLTAGTTIDQIRDTALVGGRRVVLNAASGIGTTAPLNTQVASTAAFDFTTAFSLTGIKPGDTVKVSAGYTGGGTAGSIYKYIGQPSNLDLSAQNYADTSSWQIVTSIPFTYTTTADLTHVAPGDTVQLLTGYTGGGTVGAVYQYFGTEANLNLGATDYTTSVWRKVPRYSTADGTKSLLTGDTVQLASGYSLGGDPDGVYKFLGANASVNLGTEDYSVTSRWLKINIVAKFTTNQGLTNVVPGDSVKLPTGYSHGGTAGSVYQYIGQPASLDLGLQNYADTTKWQVVTSIPFKYTSSQAQLRVVSGNQVLLSQDYSHGGDGGSVYQYIGSPALLDLSNQNYANTALWTKVPFFASFYARTSTNDVAINQLAGALPIDHVESGRGATIALTAAGAIRVAKLTSSTFAEGFVGNSNVGGTINLTSTTGSVGDSGHAMLLYSGTANTNSVTVLAQGDIYIKEGTFSSTVKASNPNAGDLRLNKAVSSSSTGVVHIEVPDGALLDANNSQVRDERTTDELAHGLWSDLQLTDETPLQTGDRVKLAAGYAGGGTPGAIYEYKGQATNVNLSQQNYANTALWTLATGTDFDYMTNAPGATAKVNDTIASYQSVKEREYQTYWKYRTQQAQADAIGLADNQIYYVVVDPNNPNRVLLAPTHDDAVAGTPIVLDLTASTTLGATHRLQFIPAASLTTTGTITSNAAYLTFDSAADVDSDVDTILLGAGHSLQTGDAVQYTRVFNFTFDSSYHVKLAPAEEAFYRDQLGYDAAAITTLENKRTAEYHDLNNRYAQFGNTFNPNFTYTLTAAEQNALQASIKKWTVDQLLNTVSAGLLKPTAGTQTTIEDPNVMGHDVVIVTSKSVGNTSGQVTIDLSNPPVQLTTDQRIAFAAADRVDVTYLAGDPVSVMASFHDNGAAADTITRSTGSWVTEGFHSGMTITVAGNTGNATEKGQFYTIANVTATTISLISTDRLINDSSKTVTVTPIIVDPRTPQAVLSAPLFDFTTLQGATALVPGDTVKVQFGYRGAGDEGSVYRYKGSAATLNLSQQDYTVTSLWEKISAIDFLDNGASPDTISRNDGGSWIDDGFKVGMAIHVSGISANATASSQSYTIATVTAQVITLVATDQLTTEAGAQVSITGPSPAITKIVIDLRDDINVNADGKIDVQAGALDGSGNMFFQSGIDVFLGSGAPDGGVELPLNLDRILAGDEVRIKSRPGIFNVAAADVVNIVSGDLILESGRNSVGTAAAPIFITPYTGATLTARAANDLYISQHNSTSTAGTMNVETVSADTGGVFLVADGSIVDALDSDTPKIAGNHIELTAGGAIGEAGDFLETNLAPSGTITASAVNDIRLRETSGDMNIDHVLSSSGDVYLRADASIHDAASAAFDDSGLESRPATDIFGNNVTLTSDFGEIGSLADANGYGLDIDSRYGGAHNGVVTTASFLGTNLIETSGDLYIYEISTGIGYTAFIAAPTGSIYNGKPSGPNVLSGQTDLFARNNIGTSLKPLITQVGVLQGESTTGSTFIDNSGPLSVNSVDGVSADGAHAGGSIYINASSPVTIDKDMISDTGEIVVVALDDANDGADPAHDDVPDNLIVQSGVTVWSKQSYVKLLGGDDLTVEVGATVKAATSILLQGDFQGDKDGNDPPVGQANVDPGKGAVITILGTVNAPEITIKGEYDPDTIYIDMSAGGSALVGHTTVLGGGGNDIIHVVSLNSRTATLDIDGQEGPDTYVIDLRGGSTANLINIFDTGADGGADQLQQPFGTVTGNKITVPAGTFRTGQAVMYHGAGTTDRRLIDQRVYFVVVDPNDPTKISLALTYADATAATPTAVSLAGVTASGNSLSAIDSLTVYGTDQGDDLLLRASHHDFASGGVAFVAALHGDTPPMSPPSQGGDIGEVERINYNKNVENLLLDAKAGDDHISLDDNWVPTTIDGGAGRNQYQIGQVFKSERDAANANVAFGDEFGTVVTTRGYLSNGVSFETVINAGDDGDLFTVYHNAAQLHLFGGNGDDTFVVRAFAIEGSQTSSINTQGGNNLVQYVLAAPVDIFGGAGNDTVRIIGTEFDDQFVITSTQVFGAGIFVTYTGIERLEVDGAEGDDTFYVLSTDPNVQTFLYGGLGSDTFVVGGDVPDVLSGNTVLFPATPGNHTMQGIATSLLSLDGASSPGYTLTLDNPVMLPGETNALPRVGDVVGFSGTGAAGATDTMTIDGTSLAAAGITNPLVDQITDPATQLVGKTIEIASGPGQGRFWLILNAVQVPSTNNWTLTLQNVAQPSATWGLPDSTSKYAITHASHSFFVNETLSIDYATVFNDQAPGQTGVLADLEHATDGQGHVIVTSTVLTGLGMPTGIRSTNLENLDILLGRGDDDFTVRATAKGTATKIVANDGADLINVGSTAADNNGNLDLVQGRLTVLAGANPDAAHADHIYSNDHGKLGRANYLITPTRVEQFDLPASFVPSPPIANYNPPRPTFAGMDYDGTTEFLRIDGTDDVNIFNVQPSLDTDFTIDGRLPPGGIPIPGGGDYLMLDTQTTHTTGRHLHITALGQGFWDFTSAHKRVNFLSIERFNHVAIYAVANAGAIPLVKVYDAETNEFKFQVTAYENFFRGGVRAAVGDVNYDGIPDLITAPGSGRAATIHIYNGTPDANAKYAGKLIGSFNAFSVAYKNGVNLAVGDTTGDGANEIVVGADMGFTPTVTVFNGTTLLKPAPSVVASFNAFPTTMRGGVRVAVADLDNDGHADIIAGSGPGMSATVSIFSGKNYKLARSFLAFTTTFKSGIFVSAGDVNGDHVRDIIVSADKGWLPLVQVYSGKNIMTGGGLSVLERFQPFPNFTRTGIRVAAHPTDGGNPGFIEKVDIFAATGPLAGAAGKKVRLASYRGAGLNPTVVDRLFAGAIFDGIYLG